MIDKARIDQLLETLEDTSVQTRLKLLWNSYITIQSNLAKDPSAKHIKDLRVSEDALKDFLAEFEPKPAEEIDEAPSFPAPGIPGEDDFRLPGKQERFCQEYLKDLNATQAYIRAGYKGRRNSAGTESHKLLKKPEIQKRISFLQAARAQEVKVTQEEILMNIMKIARLNPDRDNTTAKWGDVTRANELAGKHIGMFQEAGQRFMDPQDYLAEIQRCKRRMEETTGKRTVSQDDPDPKGETRGEGENSNVDQSEKPRVLN